MMRRTLIKCDASKYLGGVQSRQPTEWKSSQCRVQTFRRMFQSIHPTTANQSESEKVRDNVLSYHSPVHSAPLVTSNSGKNTFSTDAVAAHRILLRHIEALWIDSNRNCTTASRDAREFFVQRGRGADVARSVAASKLCEGSAGWARSHNFDGDALQTVFDGVVNSKRFIDRSMAYCFLCREPVGNLGSHCGWWDHVTRHAWLRLCATYRRVSHPERVIVDAFTVPSNAVVPAQQQSASSCVPKRYIRSPRLLGNRLPSLVRWVNHLALSRDMTLMIQMYASHEAQCAMSDSVISRRLPALDDPQAQSRRRELAAVIVKLVEWGAVRFSFSESRPGANGNGERCFRGTVSRLANMMLPPSGAQAMTRVQQKIWGRKNIELLFDELQLGALVQKRIYGHQPSTTKNEKGETVRQLIYELHCLCDVTCDDEELDVTRLSGDADTPIASLCCPPRAVVQLLAEDALHRLAFELMYLRTCLNNEEAFALWADVGFPCAGDTEGRDYY